MVGLGSLAHQWTLRAGVAMGDEPYDMAPGDLRTSGGVGAASTLKGRRSSREDEPVLARDRGPVPPEHHTGAVRNGELAVGAGNPTSRLLRHIQHSEEQPTP